MSKILVIEPHRILQQGIAMSLYPENDVQLLARVPEDLEAGKFDAAIVDAASLRETGAFDAAALKAIQAWQWPTIWIEDGAVAAVAGKDNAITIERPIERETLVAALRQCLHVSGANSGSAAAEARARGKAPPKEPAAGIIELTEVVEESDRSK